MKKLILGLALSALAMTGAKASVTMFEQMFMFDCIEFVTANGLESDRDNTGVKITGAYDGTVYRIMVDNTSTIGMTNKPVITGIAFFDGLAYLEDDPALSGVGLVSFQNSDNPGVNGEGDNFDAMTDIGVERNPGQIDDTGINPDMDILMVDFTPKAGVTAAQITTAFLNQSIGIKMHLQSYPGDGQTVRDESEKRGVKPCNEIPEPSRALIGLVGIAGCGLVRRRRAAK